MSFQDLSENQKKSLNVEKEKLSMELFKKKTLTGLARTCG